MCLGSTEIQAGLCAFGCFFKYVFLLRNFAAAFFVRISGYAAGGQRPYRKEKCFCLNAMSKTEEVSAIPDSK